MLPLSVFLRDTQQMKRMPRPPRLLITSLPASCQRPSGTSCAAIFLRLSWTWTVRAAHHVLAAATPQTFRPCSFLGVRLFLVRDLQDFSRDITYLLSELSIFLASGG